MSGRTYDRETNDSLGNIPKHLLLTVAAPTYQMKPGDQNLSAISEATDGVGIITLPSLAEAVGKFYFIIAPTGATGDDVLVYEKETGAVLATYGDLDADGDHVLLYAAPTAWLMIFDGVA